MSRREELSSITCATGGCLCGEVRYEVNGPMQSIMACHCEQCRRTSGHFVAATAVKGDDVTLTEEKGLRWYHSSDIARRGFCGTCGSSLFWEPTPIEESTDLHHISIMAGTLDSPTGLALTNHIFVEWKGDYYDLTDGKPQFAIDTDGEQIA